MGCGEWVGHLGGVHSTQDFVLGFFDPVSVSEPHMFGLVGFFGSCRGRMAPAQIAQSLAVPHSMYNFVFLFFLDPVSVSEPHMFGLFGSFGICRRLINAY